ncbi:MAG: ABC transporter ATP-binding protein [Proteobacteria bacterium]|jgi:lipoprotein-releasing system ATP-binding protein|nr:ABC transporter ATP-binding protein [Pseudomonadota bacterium]
MSRYLIQAKQIQKIYEKASSRVDVLHGVDFSIEAGKTIAIMGESGVGKSTFLQILGGLLRPTAGEVLFEGQSIFNRSESEVAHYRNSSIGFIFQFHYLLPEFTALENATLPMRIAGKNLQEYTQRATQLLERIGLGHRIHHRPSELSGGEQQRVAIVRALVNQPKAVLADEPTGNLDTETALYVSNLLLSMVKEHGMSLVIATHSEILASKADDIYRLKSGKLGHEAHA